MKCKRNKAWIGAAISAATNIVGGLIRANQEKKLQRRKTIEELTKSNMERAAAMTNQIANGDDIDEYYKDKFEFKNGGYIVNSIINDKRRNKMKCGGKQYRKR